ncbi:Uma2 family endonuclease [bacterium]|nr:Uma2 family endonuclease [bacterium]
MSPQPHQVKFTYDDYLLFPNDGKRHEIIDGDHYVTPSPTTKHQRISLKLSTSFEKRRAATAQARGFFCFHVAMSSRSAVCLAGSAGQKTPIPSRVRYRAARFRALARLVACFLDSLPPGSYHPAPSASRAARKSSTEPAIGATHSPWSVGSTQTTQGIAFSSPGSSSQSA